MAPPQRPTIVATVDDDNNRHTVVPEQPRANNRGSPAVARRANNVEVGQEVRQTLLRLNLLLDQVLNVDTTGATQVGTVTEVLEEAVPSDNLESQDELRHVLESLDINGPLTEELIARTAMGQERGVCFVTCEANSIAFDALVDTGAAKSLMTPKLAAVLQAQVIPADTCLASVTGARIPTEGTAIFAVRMRRIASRTCICCSCRHYRGLHPRARFHGEESSHDSICQGRSAYYGG